MAIFKAGTQYGDWKGSSAADGYLGTGGIEEYLAKKGLVNSGEICIAFSMSVGENHPSRQMTVRGSAYLVVGEKIDEIQDRLNALAGPIPVREVTFRMSHDDFVSVFKRFEVMLLLRGLKIEDREFTVVES